MNVPVEHNLHSCSRLFRFLLPLLSNETLLRLSVRRLTSAVTCFAGSAAAAVAPRTDFFSDAHADVPRVVGTHEPISSSTSSSSRLSVQHSEAEISPYRINISYLWTTDQWTLFFYWAHRECRRSSPPPRFPDPSPGSTSDDIFSWPTASSSCCPTKPDTVCVKSTSRSRLMVIETVYCTRAQL